MQNLVSKHFNGSSDNIQIVNVMNKLKKEQNQLLNSNKFQNKKKNVRTKNVDKDNIKILNENT